MPGTRGTIRQEQFALEYTNGEPSGLARATADQDARRSDGCLSMRAPRLLLGRAPTPQASGEIIKQTGMKALAAIPALSQAVARGVS